MHQSSALAPVISVQKEWESFGHLLWLVILDLFCACVWESWEHRSSLVPNNIMSYDRTRYIKWDLYNY